jgi:hypothetical protein
MQNQIITPEVSALDIIRAETVSDIMRGYGATRAYAEHLFSFFASDWFAFEYNDKDPEAKPIQEEGQKFRDALRKAGHSNPSVAWTRVRQEGAKLAEGEASEDGEDGEDGEGEGDKAGAKQVRGLTLRMVEELSALHKACKREEGKNNLDEKQSAAHAHICAALAALGVDLNMVK